MLSSCWPEKVTLSLYLGLVEGKEVFNEVLVGYHLDLSLYIMRVGKNQYIKRVFFGGWARYSGISFRVSKTVGIEKNKQTNKNKLKQKTKQNKGI